MKHRRSALARAALAPLIMGAVSACVSTEEIALSNDCYEILSAGLEIDCESSQWSLSGVCARVKHPSCAPISEFHLRIGEDKNENGKLDDNEVRTELQVPGPSSTVCFGAMSGNFGEDSKPIIFDAKIYIEGQAKPIFSDSDSVG